MTHTKSTKYRNYLKFLKKNVSGCSNILLMKDRGERLEFITTRTCKDKLCAICNNNRKVLLRKKYIEWFKKNPYIYEVEPGRYLTRSNGGMEKGTETAYDLMHLTLTVPHRDGYYKGEALYYRQLLSDFNRLRKVSGWNCNVFGGEFGVETTKNRNGMHIHIHALLFVRQFPGNRNHLHRFILKEWNRITNDPAQCVQMSQYRKSQIMKGNSTLTVEDIEGLKLGGATLIGLENIYTVKDGRKIVANNEESRIKAVLETISYHFKPNMFDVGDGHYDVQTIAAIYSQLKGKQLYSKFGVLLREKSLNLRDFSLIEELELSKKSEMDMRQISTAKVDVEIETKSDYFATMPSNVFIDTNDKVMLRNPERTKNLNTSSTKEALAIIFGYAKI